MCHQCNDILVVEYSDDLWRLVSLYFLSFTCSFDVLNLTHRFPFKWRGTEEKDGQ